jgi:hypothetical protein
MGKKILILSGSPKKNGNTAALVDWFSEGAHTKGADVEIGLNQANLEEMGTLHIIPLFISRLCVINGWLTLEPLFRFSI